MDLGTSMLRIVQAVAENGSVSAAARALGYSQSAVSRQVASAERQVGRALFERTISGMRPTRAGTVLLRHVSSALRELDDAALALASSHAPHPPLRLGAFPSAAAIVIPHVIQALAAAEIKVTTRQAPTPSLVRAVRAGTLDYALVTQRPPFRPLDDQTPSLIFEPLLETTLMLAVAANGPLAQTATISAEQAAAALWVAPPASTQDPHLGVWPGLPGRPRVGHRASDWLTRLLIVAAGGGVTTIPGRAMATLVPGVKAVTIAGFPQEVRRIGLLRATGAGYVDRELAETAMRSAFDQIQ
jgi:DNA-binding transcriptional LysR family regulator